jgi:hypothetical protein
MSSTACESEALDRLIAPLAAKIARSSGTTVEAIVTNAQNVHAALTELEPHGRKARQLLALRSGLSRAMMSKLETIGRHAQLLRHMARTLPPSVSSLYALARKPWPEFKHAVMMDLRGKSRAEIRALFAPRSPPRTGRKHVSILLPPDLAEAAKSRLMADIEEALARIGEAHGVYLAVSSPASRKEGPVQDTANAPGPGAEKPARGPVDDAGRDAGRLRDQANAVEPGNGRGDGARDEQSLVAEPPGIRLPGSVVSPVKKSENLIPGRPGRTEIPLGTDRSDCGRRAAPQLLSPRPHRRANGGAGSRRSTPAIAALAVHELRNLT